MKSANIILIVLAIGLFYTFSSPVYQEVKVLKAEAGEYQDLIDNVSRIADTRDALLSSYQAIPRSEMERLSRVLPDTVDAVKLAYDLDNIGGRYGIAVKDVRVSTTADPNAALAVLPSYDIGYDTATVTFSFISNYSNFIKMIADLEKSLRIMDVKSVFFEAEDAGLYEHTVVVETYWLK
jgi:hypothetical protein